MIDRQLTLPLVNALVNHISKKPISFHVPGHKYGLVFPDSYDTFKALLQMDATELSGLDDLHAPEGAILQAEELLAELFQVKRSYFLVNGSTGGNLAMIMTACSEDDIVLVQRNCHKSVLNALQLAKAKPVFIEPEYSIDWKIAAGVSVNMIKEAICLYPEARAIILTYPNYYGLVYNLKEIIDIAHQKQIPVLVDEAHGAHLIVGHPFPASAVSIGADMVVQSAHKTLPAMTMGSFLHFNSQLLSSDKLEHYLQIFQSSSPSYPIMASLDIARQYLAAYNQQDLSDLYVKIDHFKAQLADISAIKVLDYPTTSKGDLLKVTIQSRCELNGYELQQRLEGRSLYPELADPNNVLLILPLLKAGQEFPLEEAAAKVADSLADCRVQERAWDYTLNGANISRLAVDYKEMAGLTVRAERLAKSVGQICAEQIIPYPPGIPLLFQGELITAEKLTQLFHLLEAGARVQGGALLHEGQIKVFTA
ncbi:aminotransferase class I/II-fold pyridoxal phosphate-dependent enzyme [Neobacillus sp. OS1-32]|jgi:arginine/lysine/ornithine decarboxylase|uniref:aminotransferase class I/II-fold pyridoxal phosphate-dependent enzyme n=1 Tax=Neobacillus TaxID=2675232 RepID=UPI001F2AEE82|nr:MULTISPECIES: aminotransferase class I/II-fold pyridoxal phosphate-dependent enzyme [Neobacillus]WML29504.1 aminotransferase class I/II-fold pyridoxal phosphate-dependent enzyme [Neobacillus sp. OS1-32]